MRSMATDWAWWALSLGTDAGLMSHKQTAVPSWLPDGAQWIMSGSTNAVLISHKQAAVLAWLPDEAQWAPSVSTDAELMSQQLTMSQQAAVLAWLLHAADVWMMGRRAHLFVVLPHDAHHLPRCSDDCAGDKLLHAAPHFSLNQGLYDLVAPRGLKDAQH